MQEKADSDLVRRQNRRIVLQALRRQGPMARVELGRITGLSPASITSIAAQLINENILAELDGPLTLAAGGTDGRTPGRPPVRPRGRPLVRLGLRPDAACVLAARISIDALGLALADFTGNVVARTTIHMPTYEIEAKDFGRDIAAHIKRFLKEAGTPLRAVSRVCVALQGQADIREGTLVWSPAFRARNIPLARPIAKSLGIPCQVANDANMIAEGYLSLTRQSDARRTTATIFTGYGVGMGLIIDGKVYHGATGGAAEFGHMNHIPHGTPCRCGRRGCIEAYAADYGILRNATGDASEEVPHTAVPAETMARLQERALKGDAKAIAAFAKAGEALGFGIARLIALVDPHHIVLAGPGLQAQRLIEPALQRALEEGVVEEFRRNVKIEFVPFDTDMILRGTIDALLREVDSVVTATGAGRNEGESEVA